jgi:hypothetical protein
LIFGKEEGKQMITTERDPLDVLRDLLPQIPDRSRSFASDLIEKGRRWGLSEKQAYWVNRLIQESQRPAPAATNIGDLSRVLELFRTAAAHLKRPGIVLRVGATTIKLSVASEAARHPGTVNVADHAPYGMGRFYGRISRDGRFEPSRTESPAGLPEKLREFAQHPARVAAEHGRLTGHCCFCNLPLSDERSTDAGYGPVCAEHWGLAWGQGYDNDREES